MSYTDLASKYKTGPDERKMKMQLISCVGQKLGFQAFVSASSSREIKLI